MAFEIRMPELSADMTEADLTAWLVKPGDRVKVGDLIAEIETDKSTVEFEAPATGTMGELLVAPGTNGVAVGTLLATIEVEEEGDAPAPESTPPESVAASTPNPAPEAKAPRSPLPAAVEAAPAGVDATALARRLALQSGVELAQVSGSGAGGRIVKSDVQAVVDGGARARETTLSAPVEPSTTQLHAQQDAEQDAQRHTQRRQDLTVPEGDANAPFRAVPHSRMRRTIAARLTEAKQTVPHFYLSAECQLDALLAVRARVNGEDGHISINDFVLRAAALALLEVPDANVTWTDEDLLYYERVDISVAVATDGGLVTPVVRDAGRKELAAISSEVRELAERARAGSLLPAEYQGGTFTVSNLGMFGIDTVYPILNPPQSCILGVGRAAERAVARDGALAVAKTMTCTLAADHRAVDGAVGAKLLAAFKRRIEDPLEMLL